MSFDFLVETSEGFVSVSNLKTARVIGEINYTGYSGSGVAPSGYLNSKGIALGTPRISTDTRGSPYLNFSNDTNFSWSVPNNSNDFTNDFIVKFIRVD